MKLITVSRIISLVFAAFIILLIKSNPVYASNYNLIPNPSFELGESNPLEWEINNSPRCITSQNEPQLNFEWSSEISQSGTRSISLKNIYWEDIYNPVIPGQWITKDFIDITPSPSGYEFSAWVYAGKNNHSISPRIGVCVYDKNEILLSQSEITPEQTPEAVTWFELKSTMALSSIRGSKIKIILNSRCSFNPKQITEIPCAGSFWFDNISVRPINAIVAHTFNDLNKNGYPDWKEENLTGWENTLYMGSDCAEGHIKTSGWTNTNGNIIFTTNTYFPPTSFPPGSYSVKQTFYMLTTVFPFRTDARNEGWINTTPTCQNITLDEGQTPTVYFGNVRSDPLFPYLSQLDPTWKDLTYDHASTTNPFFCGTTIGGCGCAITSSAMLLNYYGADKAPNGQPTNPATLNDWLYQNQGYSFGALKWNSVAAFSVKAHEAFSTQEIRFVGAGSANDFSTLDTDLANNKPDILSEPGHFIVATKKADTSYLISDPAYESRKTLEAYGNSFTGIRRFEKTSTDLSALYITTPAPNDLFITDSLGRRAGKEPQTGQTLTEIPNSYYFLEPSLIDQTQQNAQASSAGVNTLVIINPPQGTFDLQSQSGPIDVSAYDTLGNIKVKNFSPISPDSFEINFSPNLGSDFSVFQKAKIEIKPQNLNRGNGVIPVVIKSDNNFDAQDIDFNSIRFTSAQIIPVKFPLFVQNGKDNKKDMQVFFFANEIPPDSNLCLTGITTDGLTFKGCST